jgi:hypothetical protein
LDSIAPKSYKNQYLQTCNWPRVSFALKFRPKLFHKIYSQNDVIEDFDGRPANDPMAAAFFLPSVQVLLLQRIAVCTEWLDL